MDNSVFGYFVVKDAIAVEDGGLKPGCRLSNEELRAMLRMGTLTAGTILRRKRQFFQVVLVQGKGTRRVHWKLVPYKG